MKSRVIKATIRTSSSLDFILPIDFPESAVERASSDLSFRIRAADIESPDLYRTTADSFLFHPGRQLHPTLPRERRDQAAWPRDRPGDSADGGPVHAQQGTILYMACGELAPPASK